MLGCLVTICTKIVPKHSLGLDFGQYKEAIYTVQYIHHSLTTSYFYKQEVASGWCGALPLWFLFLKSQSKTNLEAEVRFFWKWSLKESLFFYFTVS